MNYVGVDITFTEFCRYYRPTNLSMRANSFFVLCLMLTFPIVGFTQPKWTLKDRWRNSLGAAVHLLHVKDNVSPAFGVFYNPQINVVNNYADFSVAATMPLTIGAHIKDSWIEKSYFYAHIPAMLEASLGHYSTRDFRSNIGMALGAGYAAQLNGKQLSSGPVATLAARTWFFKGSITLRYMFHYSVQGDGFHSHNLSLAMNFGNYFKKLTHANKMSKFQNFKQ